jgi:V/A-type H+-transporting ATPase subunit I
MAIASLKRVTLAGTTDQKSKVLAELQTLGVLHLIDLSPSAVNAGTGDLFKDTRLALQYLEECPQKQRPARYLAHFNPNQQVERILKLKADIEALTDERENLLAQIDQLKTWGQFCLPKPEELDGLRFFFYELNSRQFRQLVKTDYAYRLVKQDSRYRYVVIIHPTLPDLPFPPLDLPQLPLNQLKNQLEDIEDNLENLETRRIGATRFIDILRSYLLNALNETELQDATHRTYDNTGLFALQGWCPVNHLNTVMELAEKLGLAVETEDPVAEDAPPTYFENTPAFAPGESLVQIYATPAYRSWDPSAMVYVSFVLFFGMIMADAGYGVVLTILVLIFRGKLLKSGQQSLWRLFMSLAISALIYGVLTGEYFGLEPPKDTWLEKIAIFQPNLEKIGELMGFAIGIGVLHVVIANGITIYQKWGKAAAWMHLSWILVIIGGYAAWLFQFMIIEPQLATLGTWAIGVGLVGVFCFSHPPHAFNLKGILQWFLGGLHGLTEVSKVFGDVLSYLRLFALGLSSTYLAITFNQLAADAAKAGELGLLLAFLIALVGHAMNFVLCIMAGTIHGLRLNFIEFYRWSQDPEAEGHPFKPLQKHLSDGAGTP